MNPQNLIPALVSHLLGHTQAAPEIPLRFLGGLGGRSGAAAPSYDEHLAITDRPDQSLASSPEKLVDARSGCDGPSMVPPSDPSSVAVPPGMSERSVDSRQSLSGAAGDILSGNFADLKANVMASIAKAESGPARKKPAKSEQLAALPDLSMPLLDGDGLGVSDVVMNLVKLWRINRVSRSRQKQLQRNDRHRPSFRQYRLHLPCRRRRLAACELGASRPRPLLLQHRQHQQHRPLRLARVRPARFPASHFRVSSKTRIL